MANRTATLYIRITTADGKRRYCKAAYQSKGRLKPQYAMVNGEPEHRKDGVYYVRFGADGGNPYRRSLGTSVTLEVNIHTEEANGKIRQEYDLRTLAFQILSLTKLNWASTDSLCGEPITTKYAGDIA